MSESKQRLRCPFTRGPSLSSAVDQKCWGDRCMFWYDGREECFLCCLPFFAQGLMELIERQGQGQAMLQAMFARMQADQAGPVILPRDLRSR